MRRSVLLLTSAALPALFVGLIHGCSSGPPVEDLCAFISKDNCYLDFHKTVKNACAPGDATGAFQNRAMLDACIIASGGSVVFDPPIDLTMLPLGTARDGGAPLKVTFNSPTGLECGSVVYEGQFSFALTIDTPDGGAMGAGGGGTGGAGVDGGAIFGGTFTAKTLPGHDFLDVSCPNSLETHHFDRLQVSGSPATGTDTVNGCPAYANIIPQAILEVSPGGIQAAGYAKLTIRFPPAAGVDPAAMGSIVPDDVVYFNCTIPGAPLQCQNGMKDGAETDVDCGGTETSPMCPARCIMGQACTTDCDCDAGLSCQVDAMDMGKKKCLAGNKVGNCTLICSDGVKDSTETDVDCGGGCPGCPDGKMCKVNTDCQSGACTAGVCTMPNCMDKAKNGAETGVDCGGPTCPKCPDGQGCMTSNDCMNSDCAANNICSPCGNGKQDGNESDVDCGGSCPKCLDGKTCISGADCANGNCFMNKCVSCMDTMKDGNESDVDCGGSCSKCPEGKLCNTGADCTFGVCDANKTCNTCTDTKKDGSETDVDCGGSCAKCMPGQGCMVNTDCVSMVCLPATKKCQ